MRVSGFDWDEVNTEKLALHGLSPSDVEWLFEYGDCQVFRHPNKRQRWIALGFVPDDRFVVVAFEYDQEARWVRVVTAYEPTNERWWRSYEKNKTRKP